MYPSPDEAIAEIPDGYYACFGGGYILCYWFTNLAIGQAQARSSSLGLANSATHPFEI